MFFPSSRRISARYKSKRELSSSDGEERVVYEYGPRQVANRHKEKAKRLEKLRKSLSDLRSKYRKDLDAKDPTRRLTALAVALIDLTYERVGNEKSAENGHFGVTTWRKKHVSLSKDRATIKYVGKAGVSHEKVVEDPKVLSVLRKALEGKGKDDPIFCEGDDCRVLAEDVNAYLERYGVTAKDLRGYHANEEVRRRLVEFRKKGPELPRARKERGEILKDEFLRAVEEAAEAVGHEPETLRSNYLVPSLEDEFLHDGTVVEKFATKTRLEREDEEAQRLVRRSPKKRAPRRDLERGRVKDVDETDPDERQDKKDRSNNYKDASASRVALRFFLSKVTVTDSGRFRAERSDVETPRYFDTKDEAEDWVSEDEGSEDDGSEVGEGAPSKGDAKKGPEPKSDASKTISEATESLYQAEKELVSKALEGYDEAKIRSFAENLSEAKTKLSREGVSEELREFGEFVRDSKEALRSKSPALLRDPKAFAQAVAAIEYYDKIVDDPLVSVEPRLGPISESSEPPKNPEKASLDANKRTLAAIDKYRQFEANDRKNHVRKLRKEIDALPEGSERRVQLEAVERGIAIAAALADPGGAQGISASLATLAKAADKSGNLASLVALGDLNATEALGASDQDILRKVYRDLDDSDWAPVVGEDHPARELVELLNDPDQKKYLTPDDLEFIRDHLQDMMVAEATFLDPLVNRGLKNESVKKKTVQTKKLRATSVPELRLQKLQRSGLQDQKDKIDEWLRNARKAMAKLLKGEAKAELPPTKSASLRDYGFEPWGRVSVR